MQKQETKFDDKLLPELEAKVLSMCQGIAFAEEITDDQSMYVAARGCFTPNNQHTFKLEKVIRQKFLPGEQTVLLLEGESGTGKSLFGQTFIRKLAGEYKPGDRIPFFISLPTYREVARNNLLQTVFTRYGFSAEEILILKNTQQFLFLLDAYDEIHTLDNFYVTNKLNEWRAKVMISCRTSYLTPHGGYKMYFVPYEGEKAQIAKLLEIHVAPFNPQQVTQYIKQYLKVKQDELQEEILHHPDLHKKWLTPAPYHEAIEQIPDMKQLIQNPFLLRITMDVLPSVLAKYEQERDHGQRTQMTSRALYSAFIERWFRRQEEKLISESKHPGGNLAKDYHAFSQRLARKMHEMQLTHVTFLEESDLFDDEPSENEWSMFFSDRMIKLDNNNPTRQMRRILSRKGCPLVRVGTDQYAFIHASIISFFVAAFNDRELMKGLIAEAPPVVAVAVLPRPIIPAEKIITANSGRQYEIVKVLSPQEESKVLEEEGIAVRPDPLSGKIILGRGAFGKFRLAKCLTNGRYCGVKNINGEFEIRTSKNEADLQAQLSTQSNLMPIWDFVTLPETEEKGAIYYQFMPLAGYGNGVKFRDNLNQFLYTDNNIKAKLLVYVVRELLKGLRNMHMLSIYHLDLKPDNFVIDNHGNVYIIDFGCAKRVDSVKERNVEYITRGIGDMAYFSPERRNNYEQRKAKLKEITPIDPAKVDTWALGVTLLELALGRSCVADVANSIEQLGRNDQLGNARSELMSLVHDLLNEFPEKRVNADQALASPIFQRTDLLMSTKEKKQAFADLYDESKHKVATANVETLPSGSMSSDATPYAASYATIDYDQQRGTSLHYRQGPLHYDDPSVLTDRESPALIYGVPTLVTGKSATAPKSAHGFWSKNEPAQGGGATPPRDNNNNNNNAADSGYVTPDI